MDDIGRVDRLLPVLGKDVFQLPQPHPSKGNIGKNTQHIPRHRQAKVDRRGSILRDLRAQGLLVDRLKAVTRRVGSGEEETHQKNENDRQSQTKAAAVVAVDGAEDPNKQPESEEEHPTAGGRVEKQGYHLRCGAKSGHHSGA